MQKKKKNFMNHNTWNLYSENLNLSLRFIGWIMSFDLSQ